MVTEEGVQERLGMRRRASMVRKASIFESLAKWEADEDLFLLRKPQSSRRAADDIHKKEQMRRRSADEALFLEEKEEEGSPPDNRAKSIEPLPQSSAAATSSPLASIRTVTSKVSASTTSPLAPKRDSEPRKESSASPVTTERASPPPKDSSSLHVSRRKMSNRRIKGASKGNSSNSNFDKSMEVTEVACVDSAPSQSPPNRNGKAGRRASRGPKSSNSIQDGHKPRRTKSSCMESLAEHGRTKIKKNKRRSQSADNEVAFAEVAGAEEKKGKKGRAKRRNSHKRTSQPNDASENDTAQQSKQPQNRRGSMAGSKKRCHSARSLKRNKNEGRSERGLPARAASMMLNRDTTRRGKADSLHDLVQYSAEEIHSTSYFASNHVLVNRERMKRGLRPLTRNVAMDTLARESAEAMASSEGSAPLRTTYVGNVLRGESIRAVHRAVVLNKQGRERANMLNPYFQDFGVGTAKGKDGMLYVCQLYSERLELSCTDLAIDE